MGNSAKVMFHSALRVFKKNIWDVFAVAGFIAIGILVGVLFTTPAIVNEVNVSVNKIVAHASAISYSGFDASAFLRSLIEQAKNLDTRNPLRTVNMLIEQNGVYRIFMNALRDANFNEEVLIQMKDVVAQCSDNLITIIKQQLIYLAICILISFIIALVATRIVIQIRSTSVRHVGKFFASFFLNFGTVIGAYCLIALCILNIENVTLIIVCALLILMAMLTLALLWSVICYKKKGTKLLEFFNIKNILFLWLASLAVIITSGIIFLIVYLINEIAALVILLPLIIISNIICENIAIDFINNHSEEKKEQNSDSEQKNEAEVKASN